MKIKLPPESTTDRDALINAAFEAESPRGRILIICEMLNVQLAEVLLKFFHCSGPYEKIDKDDLLGRERPLSSFSSRIVAAYRLGLISETDFKALNKLREFRNVCAHECANFSYDDDRFQAHLKQLVEFIGQDHAAALKMCVIGPCPQSDDDTLHFCAIWMSGKLSMLLENLQQPTAQAIQFDLSDIAGEA